MRFALGEADRERLGAPDWFELPTWESLDVLDAAEIEDVLGITVEQLVSGEPQTKSLIGQVWLALKAAGVDVPLKGFRFDLLAVRAEGEPEGGKDDAPVDSETTSTPTG